jgi:hypothetical protein
LPEDGWAPLRFKECSWRGGVFEKASEDESKGRTKTRESKEGANESSETEPVRSKPACGKWGRANEVPGEHERGVEIGSEEVKTEAGSATLAP